CARRRAYGNYDWYFDVW
nr:immunoglobulin heavy chain junction region [Mus musculus]